MFFSALNRKCFLTLLFICLHRVSVSVCVCECDKYHLSRGAFHVCVRGQSSGPASTSPIVTGSLPRRRRSRAGSSHHSSNKPAGEEQG